MLKSWRCHQTVARTIPKFDEKNEIDNIIHMEYSLNKDDILFSWFISEKQRGENTRV